MKGDLLSLHLAVLDFDLISGEDHRDIITHTRYIAKPVWHIFVSEIKETMFRTVQKNKKSDKLCRDSRDSRCHIKHDDRTLALNVIAISQSTEPLLTGCVPHIESDRPTVCVEYERVHFDADSC